MLCRLFMIHVILNLLIPKWENICLYNVCMCEPILDPENCCIRPRFRLKSWTDFINLKTIQMILVENRTY